MIFVETTRTGCVAICSDHELDGAVYPVVPGNMNSLKEAYQAALSDVLLHADSKDHSKEAADGR